MTAYESRFADLHRRGSRIRSTQTPILVLGALLALSACAPLAQVREIRPSLGAQHGTLPQLRHAEQAITEGDNVQRADPTRAIGFYLSGVRSATSELRKDPNDRVALRDYDFALSRVFSVIHDAHLDPWTRPLHVPAPNGGQYLLTHRAIANRLWRPQDYELIPADELDVRGKFVVPRVTREGAGAALVAVRHEQAGSTGASARSNSLIHLPPRASTSQVELYHRVRISLRQ